MSERISRPSSPYLEPPRKSVELEDPGAQESTTNSDDEHFSDASEGHQRPESHPPSGRASPVPLTRVEKVDEEPSHGEVPGTAAYEIRDQDAVPDQIEVIPEGSRSRSASASGERPVTPTSIPRTVVEKVDLDQPSHGDIPGTPAYEKRKADAVPDVVKKASDSDSDEPSPLPGSFEASAADTPVPETLLSRVESNEDDVEEGPVAHQPKPIDSEPDHTETIPDAPGKPDFDSPASHRSHTRRESSVNDAAAVDTTGADEFDDFAEEQEDDDFGDFDDFDDGFQEPMEAVEDDPAEIQPSQPPTPPSVPPLLDLDAIPSLADFHTTLSDPLDRLFPSTKDTVSLQPLDPIPNPTAIFSTERSLSLWSQLVAPPPLQPQNWVKSRIRRLFLVSLGVPVDLDEILPASKQKKLILPSVNLDDTRRSSTPPTAHSRSQSLAAKRDSTQSGPGSPGPNQQSRTRTSRRREPSPPPELDLPAVHRLCATTDAALDGLTDGELRGHVQELESATLRASSVLEYWLKRLDGLVSEKEAFEGVIENLVSHARRVRK
ncbi:hypothetical protein BO85DRAFT_407755 [Aspergillus piperis CBS 112811]|uniref:Uncharacterized protein n=1 Tax=Aspergillus piperis CBS 112811 TaxID=1448313 RepID=A0A8G1VGT5_9EURO|nr:hypothetical protein BO85DRAFT_407755 [Aspergillus piperis CBS 112811]RAH52624.1 hypothetical protein BO85DRAFT_407755 [Aspergillus piperis CBS 112811]